MGSDGARADWLKLLLAPGIGLGRLGPVAIADSDLPGLPNRSENSLRELGLTPALIRSLKSPDLGQLAECERWLDHPAHHLVTRADALYPPLLRRIDDAPPALFVNGDPDCLVAPQIAIVGSRNASPGGRETATEFAAALSRAGLVVTSGLAVGIDGAAHRAAIDAGGRTVAVAGTGPDRVYPARHRDLAREIVDNGAVVTTFAPGVGPRPLHFPARNRIISGMSLGVLVIEAGVQSGSLITARLAGEQGREIFAVPGSIRNPVSRGCHQLIRQGARLVESAADVVSELEPLVAELAGELRGLLDASAAGPGEQHPAGAPPPEDPEVQRVLEAVGFDPTPVDEIIQRAELTTQAVSSMLLSLELDGLIASHSGGRYSRTGKETERNS